MSSNLDTEFKKLMEEVLEKIQEQKASGKYESWEAGELTDKVNAIIDHGDVSNFGRQCPEGHTDPDCGWSPSMGYHCT